MANLCNPASSFTGQMAKYIDKCSLSNTVKATVKNVVFETSNVDMTLWATVAPYSSNYCYELPLIGTNAEGHEETF